MFSGLCSYPLPSLSQDFLGSSGVLLLQTASFVSPGWKTTFRLPEPFLPAHVESMKHLEIYIPSPRGSGGNPNGKSGTEWDRPCPQCSSLGLSSSYSLKRTWRNLESLWSPLPYFDSPPLPFFPETISRSIFLVSDSATQECDQKQNLSSVLNRPEG